MFQFASQADGASADAKIIVSSGLSFFFCFFFFSGRRAESGPGTIFACGFTERAREALLPASMLGYTSLTWSDGALLQILSPVFVNFPLFVF